MTYRSKSRRALFNSDGVAIIIVLGLIAALMLMAVAFSIHMRIERTGAANYRHSVVARHMIWSGLASAIKDMDDLMVDTNTGLPMIYPDKTVWASLGDSNQLVASVLSQMGANYLPSSSRDDALAETAYWQYIGHGGVSRGRYAFIIVNTSGLLEANRVGGLLDGAPWPRGGGTNCNEIQLIKETGVTSPTEFANKRDISDGRYETLPELTNVNERVGDGSSFSVFSLSPVKS